MEVYAVELRQQASHGITWAGKQNFFAEVEPFPSAVLMERFGATRPLRPLEPDEATSDKDRETRKSWKRQISELSPAGTLPNFGDFTKIKETDYDGKIDLLVGGCPCQSYSVAGLRLGLEDYRGNLSLEFVKLAYRTGARILVFENVPGILSSGDKGSDFASFLSLLVGWEVKPPKDGWKNSGIVTNAPGCFGVAWRILDAQYTRVPEFPRAVPQRRRRLILVGYLGDWKYSAKVLFDGEMCGGNTPPCRKKRQKPAGDIEKSIDKSDPIRTNDTDKGSLNNDNLNNTSKSNQILSPETKETKFWNGNDYAETITATGDNQRMLKNNYLQCVVEKSTCLDMRQIDVREELAPALMATDYKTGKMVYLENHQVNIDSGQKENQDSNSICFQQNSRDEVRLINNDGEIAGAICSTTGTKQQNYICFENHGNDSRITDSGETSPTITSRAGTGGNNLPLVMKEETPSCSHVNTRDELIPTDIPGSLMASNNNKLQSYVLNQDALQNQASLSFTRNDVGGEKDSYWKEISPTLRKSANAAVAIAENIIGRQVQNGGNGVGAQKEVAYTQNATGVMGVAYENDVKYTVDMMGGKSNVNVSDEDLSPSLTTTHNESYAFVKSNYIVRRLLPLECERLMGFPDNWTRIPWKGKPAEECPDGSRYKACGNSMCVNVMMWIGERIEMVEEQRKQENALSNK